LSFIWKIIQGLNVFVSSNSGIRNNDNNFELLNFAAGPFRVISPELRVPFMAKRPQSAIVDVYNGNFSPSMIFEASNRFSSIVILPI
jgi:hypothetical protein